MPISTARKLVKIALEAQVCDSLVEYQEREINAGIKLQIASDSLLAVRKRSNELADQEIEKWRTRYANQVALTKIERKKKRKWILTTIGVVALGTFVIIN
jgi:hypothetical protein